jgi:hypothetical protein
MNNRRVPLFVILFLFSMFGLWQFSDGVRSVDILGLFASGALSGAAITGFLIMRKSQ